MSLYSSKGPLCPAADLQGSVAKIVLVDGNRALRNAGSGMPELPPSFRGLAGDRADLLTPQGRVIAVGCGKPDGHPGEEAFWEAAGAASIEALRVLRVAEAVLAGELQPVAISAATAARHFAIGASLAAYACIGYRSVPPKTHFAVERLGLAAADWAAAGEGLATAEAVNWTRALVDAPANLMTPQAFAREAQELSALGIRVEVLGVPELEKLGAGGLLAVGMGSVHPPCMLICHWQGRPEAGVDVGLVGKGLTYDGGGLNLKTPPGIEKMKFDMAGAAAVVGALRLLATRRAPVNVSAAIPLCENVIDGQAYRPGDIITSLSGLTIEVANTDAEGRIVLADAISHLIREYQPGVLLDIATLTGAIIVSLHEDLAGLFTADDALARSIEAAAVASNEAVWRMPLIKRQDYVVESEIADVRNLGVPGFMGNASGSSIAGAKFLEKFATGTRWAHIDIAGVAWSTRPQTGIAKGPTGFGARLLDAAVRQLESD